MSIAPLFVSAEAVQERFWRLSRPDGSITAAQIKLAADGRIIGSSELNELHWRLSGGAIEFHDEAGGLTIRFDKITKEAPGVHVLRGGDLGAGVQSTAHVLTELTVAARRSTERRVALLVRTHVINDKLLDLLRILETGRGYDLFVCADETNGPLPLPGRRVLSHSIQMCADIGLVGALSDHNLLWYFGDYPFYCAYHAIPDYDYYAMIEYDVDIVRGNTLALEGIFNRLDRGRDNPYDLVAPHYGHPGPEWGWGDTCKGRFDSIYSVLFPFVVLSARALRYLYDWRRNEAANPPPDGRFAFCEAFVPSALNAAGGFVCADLGTLIPGSFDAGTFRAGLPMLLGSLPKLSRGVELVHPVYPEREYLERHLDDARWNKQVAGFIDMLNGAVGLSLTPALRTAFLEQALQDGAAASPATTDPQRSIERLLAKYPPRDFFRNGSPLREELLRLALGEDIVEPLRRAFSRDRDHMGVALLHKEAALQGWAVERSDDLAFCKPAVTSSVCRWSRYLDPERDACGANGETPESFHTDRECEPWWKVDLLDEHLVQEVTIVNRNIEAHRFRTFRIETSCDGNAWTTRVAQVEPCEVSSDLEWPFRAWFTEPFRARYVRIVLLGMGPLHLRRVQVFGPGSVAQGKGLIGRLLARYPPRDFFRESSELRTGLLSQVHTEDIVELLRRALAKRRDHVGVALLYREAAEHGWTVTPRYDVAFCKPAMTSSVCRWSRYADPERDACGANGEPLEPFHTDKERDPWWLVDLLEECWIEQVAIVNRSIEPQRFRTFRIDTASDGNHWTTRFTQAEPCDVSSNLDSPWRLWFADPFPARYVRIVLLGMDALHLHRVQVFGRQV